jgi:hypothetical protein
LTTALQAGTDQKWRPYDRAALTAQRARRFLISPGTIMLCIAIWLTHGKESPR